MVRPRTLFAIVVAVVVTMVLSSLAVAAPAHAVPAVPSGLTPTVPLPAQVDLPGNYDPESVCDPVDKIGATWLREHLWRTYGRGIRASISRACDASTSEHHEGRAVDWSVNVRNWTKAFGDDFVTWATANNGEMALRMGIMYIIWDGRIWGSYNRQWRDYKGCSTTNFAPSSDTSCHRDHVHVSLTWHGAAGQTSWWSGRAVTEGPCYGARDVDAGSMAKPQRIFNPVAGVGAQDPCYVHDSATTIKVPSSTGNRAVVQRIRVNDLGLNAPGTLRISTSAGDIVDLPRGYPMPYVRDLRVGPDGRIDVKVVGPGQANPSIDGLGQTLQVASGQVLEVPVIGEGPSGAPADAAAVSMNLTVVSPRTSGYLTVYPCGENRPNTSNLNFSQNQTIANSVIVRPGTNGRVCVFTSATADILLDYGGFFPADSKFTSLTPSRKHDSRQNPSTNEVQVSMPPGAASVALNVTALNNRNVGWVTIYPCGTSPIPTASSLNFAPGQTVAAGVISRVGAGGKVCLKPSHPTGLLVDLFGTFASDAPYQGIDPYRLIDTRAGAIPRDGEVVVVPAPNGASAISMTLTVSAAKGGFATVFPCGTERPNASAINYAAGQTIANSMLAQVGADGNVCIFVSGSTHVMADVFGLVPLDSFAANQPLRLADTRASGKPAPNSTVKVQLPPGSTGTSWLNLTITEASAGGYATVYPCNEARPETSNVNFKAGQTISNGVLAKISPEGTVCVFLTAGAHVIVDKTGDFASSDLYQPQTPSRILDSRASGKIGQDSVQKVTVGANQVGVALNVTALNAAAEGYLQVYPCSSGRPPGSHLNFAPGDVIANNVVVGAGSTGEVCIYSSRTTDVLVDLMGSFPTGSTFEPANGVRAYDFNSAPWWDGPSFSVPPGYSAVTVNVTMVNPWQPDFATLYPCGDPAPATVTINGLTSGTIANGAVVEVGEDNRVCIAGSRSNPPILVDITGYLPATSFTATKPIRLVDTRSA